MYTQPLVVFTQLMSHPFLQCFDSTVPRYTCSLNPLTGHADTYIMQVYTTCKCGVGLANVRIIMPTDRQDSCCWQLFHCVYWTPTGAFESCHLEVFSAPLSVCRSSACCTMCSVLGGQDPHIMYIRVHSLRKELS